MKAFRQSLTAKFFAGFAISATLIIAMLAVAVIWSMRDGFANYLLREELRLFEDEAQMLARLHDPANPGWPELVAMQNDWIVHLRALVEAQRRAGDPDFNEFGDRFGDRFDDDDRDEHGEEDDDDDHGKPSGPPLFAKLFVLDAKGEVLLPARVSGPLEHRMPITDPDGGAVLGWLGISALQGISDDQDAFFLHGQYHNLFIVFLLALALSMGAAWLQARQLLRPIKALEEAARALSAGDLGARVTTDRTDELGQLITHTNAMAASIQAAQAAERRWISDTSHELQTPLAVLRAQIEALQDGIVTPDAETLEDMHEAVMRLSALVSDLKQLSFAEEGRMLLDSAPMDLAGLLDHRFDRAKPRLARQGLDLSRQIDGPLPIRGDRERLAQLFDNLLENARRYTDAPGQVLVRAWLEGSRAVVLIEDSAPGVAGDMLPRLFDRFFRAEASRSRAHGGSGLGLAICKATVLAHGGAIGAMPSALGGLSIRITLPTEPSQNDTG